MRLPHTFGFSCPPYDPPLCFSLFPQRPSVGQKDLSDVETDSRKILCPLFFPQSFPTPRGQSLMSIFFPPFFPPFFSSIDGFPFRCSGFLSIMPFFFAAPSISPNLFSAAVNVSPVHATSSFFSLFLLVIFHTFSLFVSLARSLVHSLESSSPKVIPPRARLEFLYVFFFSSLP